MSSSLPKKDNDGFFFKLKRLFSDLFNRKRIKIENYTAENIIESNKNILKENLTKTVTKNVQQQSINNMNIREVADKYASNPELLASLPVEKLEKINNYYLNLIEELTEKVKNAS